MLKYYKNFILCNDIDYYCLLCQEAFVTPEDVEKHLRWEKHRKLMKTQTCLPKFTKDGVYKIQDKLYYCEVCNEIFSTLGAVKSHVKEDNHKSYKEKPENAIKEVLAVRKHGFISIPKGNVSIFKRKEWHGVVDKYCVYCDIEATVFDSHAATPSHLLRFMQSKLVKAGKDGKNDLYYRKINDKYYCFSCKQTFPSENLEKHWTEMHTFNENSKRPKMLFDLDIENDMGTCTLCLKPFEGWMQMDRHMKEHLAKKEWPYSEQEKEIIFMELTFRDKGKMRNNLKNFGKDNFIKLNEGGSKGYCTICYTYISAHIRNFRQHVDGIQHKSQLKLRGLITTTKKVETPNYKTKPFSQYMKECIHIKTANVFLVPDAEVCIDMLSYALIATTEFKNKDSFVCFACDGMFTDLSKHLNGGHKEKMYKTQVITSIKDEFVRELRPGLYHCGVCNVTFAGYALLEKHLGLLKHRFTRAKAHSLIEDIIDPACVEAAMLDLPFSNRIRGCKVDDFLD